jgi:hypothetical protein
MALDPFVFEQPPGLVDPLCQLQVTIERNGQKFDMPVRNIIDWSFIQSEEYLFYRGHLTFYDTGAVMTEKFNFLGGENIMIQFGGLDDNRASVKGVIYSMEAMPRTKQGATVTLWWAHPGVFRGAQAIPLSHTGLLSDAVHQIFDELGFTQTSRGVYPTKNTGCFVNPGLRLTEFLSALQQFALAQNGYGAYVAFTTADNAFFVPREIFNSFSVYETYVNHMTSRYRTMIHAFTEQPINGVLRALGQQLRTGSAYDYRLGKVHEVEAKIDDLIRDKAFVGRFVNALRSTDGSTDEMIYSGFHELTDQEGFLRTRIERLVENASVGTMQVAGDVGLVPGTTIELAIDPGNELTDFQNLFEGGKWIVKQVKHYISPTKGFISFVSLRRNAFPDVADALTLRRAQTVVST